MAWLHTWVGLLTGWVLFFVFVTGTAGYMDDEITRWMQPELPLAAQVERDDDSRMISQALARLEVVAPQAKSWTVTLPHRTLEPRAEHGLSVSWEDVPPRGSTFGQFGSETLDPATGEFLQETEPRATAGGRGLYRMHYALRYLPFDVAIKVVGICTMLMLLAVITGVVTHKKIFSDFFTFRRGRGQRSWLDAHNVVSVMSLPFFLMITYTGLVFFAFTYLPAGQDVIYGNANLPPRAHFEELFGEREYEPVTMPQVSLPALVRQIGADWGTGQVASLRIMHLKDQTPHIDVRPVTVSGVNYYDPEMARFSAIDGAPLPFVHENSATARTERTMFALHEGNFANWWLRWLYFISGLLGCAVIGTGLVLWTVKRRTQHQQRIGKGDTDSFTARLNAGGLRLVEVLNAGTLAGLPLGVGAYFWANRLLPVSMAERGAWELNFVFLAWGLSLLYASIRPLKHAWLELLSVTVAAYALIPVLNVLTTDKHLGVTLPHGDWGQAGFDLTMWGLAMVFAYMAVKLQRKWRVAELTGKSKLNAQTSAVKPTSVAESTARTHVPGQDRVEGARP